MGQEDRMKILCLHGFRTSGSFLQKQISKWDPSIFQDFLMVFPDGIFPAGGKSEIEGIFPPPYFEWFQFNKEFTEYKNLEECISYLCDYIRNNGPFDGLLGFSQGATLSALLIGYQAQGKVLSDLPAIKFFVSISGSKFRDPSICEVAYKDLIKVKSVHLIGDKDWLKVPSEELATAFDDPLILRHPQGHTVPRLDETAVKQLSEWTACILKNSKSLEAEENKISSEKAADEKDLNRASSIKENSKSLEDEENKISSEKAADEKGLNSASSIKDKSQEEHDIENGEGEQIPAHFGAATEEKIVTPVAS